MLLQWWPDCTGWASSSWLCALSRGPASRFSVGGWGRLRETEPYTAWLSMKYVGRQVGRGRASERERIRAWRRSGLEPRLWRA